MSAPFLFFPQFLSFFVVWDDFESVLLLLELQVWNITQLSSLGGSTGSCFVAHAGFELLKKKKKKTESFSSSNCPETLYVNQACLLSVGIKVIMPSLASNSFSLWNGIIGMVVNNAAVNIGEQISHLDTIFHFLDI